MFLARSRGVRAPAALLSRPGTIVGARSYLEGESVYGFRVPRKLRLSPYKPDEIANRKENANLLRLVSAFRSYGHLEAELDPLGLQNKRNANELRLSEYGLENDGGKKFRTAGIIDFNDGAARTEATLDEIVHHLRATYCGRIAFEFEHLVTESERRWFAEMVESRAPPALTKEEHLRIHNLLARSETFDEFMGKRFPQVKRYGLEGAESMLVSLDTIFRSASQSGIQDIVLGMPHRGRLNLLTDVLEFPARAMFRKVMGQSELPADSTALGDVLSHLSISTNLSYGAEHPVRVSLLHNPSHLEAVNPVAMGKTRAKQQDLQSVLERSPGGLSECTIGDRVMCLQIHGDAAFTGQGIVMESLAISDIAHFSSGGSVHVIVNNQIGFTTPAVNSRSSIYTSDVGKMINAPVIHVNGDHPADVLRASEIAVQYRQKFRRDIIIDLVTYRRWGHNELDEPAFTQPEMYKIIRARSSVPQLYEKKLIEKGLLTAEEAAAIRKEEYARLDAESKQSASYEPPAEHLKGKWAGMAENKSRVEEEKATGVDIDLLKKVGLKSVAVPEGFIVHDRLVKGHVNPRTKRIEDGAGLDWATAEALAFGTILEEGNNVRLCGQDVGRGTFSHRHVMLVDQATEKIHTPLNHLSGNGHLEVVNSALSELAVLGFEYGMSLENPRLLPIWEAQFGDFFNGAQVIIDTFITSGETKWLRQSGLVMLLPHGYDGAGPEHSSSRVERFLQLSDEPLTAKDAEAAPQPNILILNCTTPAQYFHALRRQMTRNYRKPMVLVAPKTLLRLPAAVSDMSEMGPETAFKPVLGDESVSDHRVNNVIVCSGKVYYDLVEQRKKRGVEESTAIIRVEELSPFPFAQLKSEVDKYYQADQVTWVQEEPQNAGAWAFVEPRIRDVLEEGVSLKYVGRPTAAAPATGVSAHHKKEVVELFDNAFSN